MGDHNPTLRVIKILESVMQEANGLTLSEIARRCEMPKGSISPIVHTLADHQLLKYQSAEGKYNIGIKSYEIGSRYIDQSDISDEIREITKRVVQRCNETCHFAVLDKENVVYLMKQDTSESIRMVSSIGKRIPAYSTAIGKALLSGLSSAEIHSLYEKGLKPVTGKTITDIEVLLKQIQDVREKEVAYESEESSENITCIGVPLKKEGKVVAALSVSIPIFRASAEKRELVETVLIEAKKEVEELIRRVPFNY